MYVYIYIYIYIYTFSPAPGPWLLSPIPWSSLCPPLRPFASPLARPVPVLLVSLPPPPRLLSLSSPAVPPSLVQSLFSLCLLFLPVFSLCPPLPLCFPLARSVPVLLVFGYGFGLVWFFGFPEYFYKTNKSFEKTKNTKENQRKPNKH